MEAISSNSSSDLVLEFIKAFEIQAVEKMHKLFDDHIIMYITNAKAGVDKVEGRDNLLRRIQGVNYSEAHLKLHVIQILTIQDDKVMVMVQVTAHKNNIDFENFAAFLCYLRNNKITHIWQMEAKPSESDAFWKTK